MFGLVVGAIRMVLDFTYREPLCMEEDLRPAIVGKVRLPPRHGLSGKLLTYKDIFRMK
jgi:hypothetical protein